MSEHEVEYREISELSEEDLESISGGLVVTVGNGIWSLVIDDATGLWTEETYDNLEGAIRIAREEGYGDTVYRAKDMDEYKEFFRKSLPKRR